jgi:hypothetical protein
MGSLAPPVGLILAKSTRVSNQGKMMNLPGSVLAFAVGACLLAGSAEAEPDAKAVFAAKKCTLCHSVLSAGIKAPTDSKMKIIDLSGLAAKGRTATSLKAYIEKTEELAGKAHPPKFRGTPAELDALVAWLIKLKPAP